MGKFTAFVGKPLGDVQMFSDSLDARAQATKARAVAAVKSLFAFGRRIGYLRFDVTTPIKLPKLKNTLSERILTEGDVHRVIALEENARNRTLIKLLYVAGLRVSKACSLRALDVQPASDGGYVYVTIYGKGEKTRTILLDQGIYDELLSIRGGGPVSLHWFRHVHASHALDRGCPIQPRAGHVGPRVRGHDGPLPARQA
ncbi:tyrosine-type recombinase/integrase [Acetomicrobium hydrogeniformans]|uniref:tyrosine-type recombinase/integrase n=1 Tax=Acetomicrobium hydrogeniformans TaxID=649746 RepID=UPI001A94A02B|nr:tyrosine-type recombinase/integrase [Acetomicrobium hydrogeniformans]